MIGDCLGTARRGIQPFIPTPHKKVWEISKLRALGFRVKDLGASVRGSGHLGSEWQSEGFRI